MNQSETIIGVLSSLSRRLWIAKVIRETAFAACLVLFGLFCFQLVDPALKGQGRWGVLVLDLALLSAIIAITADAVMHGARRINIRQAAAHADAQARLKNELQSASWFLSGNRLSAFEDLQVRRAAATAAKLDLVRVAPLQWGGLLPVAGLGILLAALVWLHPELSDKPQLRQEAGLEEKSDSADLRSLLKNAPPQSEIAKLDEALSTLQRPGASADDRARALADARDAIEQANMEASAAREDLARLQESLKADARFERVARAMEKGHMDDAMALLRASGAVARLIEQRPDRMNKEDILESGPLATNEPAEPGATGKTAVLNQDALNRIVEALRQANERIDVQTRVNNVGRRLEDALMATTQRDQLTASHFDNRTEAANPTPSSQTGNADIRSGTLFRQGAVAQEADDSARDGSQAGDASGEARALQLEGAPTRRLNAQLKLETLLQQNELTDEPIGKGDAGWFYSASREQKSSLLPAKVQVDLTHQREAALQHNRVPMRQKELVKKYFLTLHESEKK